MDSSDSPVTAVVGRDTSTHTRLRGNWLRVARAMWVTLTIVSVAYFLVATPQLYAQSLGSLSNDALARQVTLGLGLPHVFYALYIVALRILFASVAIGTAGLMFWRRSDDWMALLCSLTFVAMAASPLFNPQVATKPLTSAVEGFLRAFGLTSFFGLFYLFPDGRFVPGWTRWLLILWVAFGLVTLLVPTAMIVSLLAGNLVLLSFLGSFIFAQIYRYRRASSPAQRQQTKWVVVSLVMTIAAFAAVVVPMVLIPSLTQPRVLTALYGLATLTIGALAWTLVPLSVGVAILRYRLWDVDFMINRGLTYGGLTLLLLVVFIGLFFAVRAIVSAALGSQQDLIAAALPAAAVVSLFNPARKWLRTVVDRRLYGIKIDYSRPATPVPSSIADTHTLRTNTGVYEHLEPIGRGGMAEVYKAQHPTLGRPVAIKILPAHLAREADFRRRFEREARTVGLLKHPNIVQMYDFGEVEGTYYMVMEYVAGRDLADVIRQSAPLPLARVTTILRDVTSALDYAHQQGLVHRDIKPSNVMVEAVTASGSQAERAVLMDFGIARIVGGGTRLTATGVLGTFDYISPEQINDARDVDGRADLYALGVMTYQMLTGKLPFTAGSTGALLMLHLRQPPPEPRDLVPDLSENASAAVLKALAKKPGERFTTAGEFVGALAD